MEDALVFLSLSLMPDEQDVILSAIAIAPSIPGSCHGGHGLTPTLVSL